MRPLSSLIVSIAAACAALGSTALADAGRAGDLGVAASALKSELAAAKSAIDHNPSQIRDPLTENLIARLQTFGASAYRLSLNASKNGLPSDFSCIFRGFSEEVDVQLHALERIDGVDAPQIALTRLISMLDDAEMVSAAAAHAFGDRDRTANADRPGSVGTCPANPAHTQYLTLQP